MRYAVGTKESPIGVYVQEGGRRKGVIAVF
jgi:hypothetical protein